MAEKLNATSTSGKANTVLANVEDRAELINNVFKQLYQADCNIAALIEQHIEPEKKERKKLWGRLKADTGIDRKDLELFYKLYKRDKDARDFEDEADREKVQDSLREVFSALKWGEQLDWLDATADDGEASEHTTH